MLSQMNSMCSSDPYSVAETTEVIMFIVVVVAVMIIIKMLIKIAYA
jgi:hypothetical protein